MFWKLMSTISIVLDWFIPNVPNAELVFCQIMVGVNDRKRQALTDREVMATLKSVYGLD